LALARVPGPTRSGRGRSGILIFPLLQREGAGGAGAGAREGARLREAAQEFEALLWEQALRAGLPGDRAWVQGAGEPVYDALVVETLAEAIARGGGAGLWRLLAGAGTR
jgi:hypothetical protein